jgi:hypothetical protein
MSFAMIAAPAFDLDNAPKELREPLKRAMAEVNRKIKNFKLTAPGTETLQKMVDAGTGEQRDRLFSNAVQDSMDKLMDEANQTVRDMVNAYKTTNAAAKDDGEKYFS